MCSDMCSPNADWRPALPNDIASGPIVVRSGMLRPTSRHWLIAAALLVVGALVFAWWRLPVDAWIEAFALKIQALGPFAPVLFALTYAACLVVCAPGAPFSIGAGLVFGYPGMVVGVVGAWLGACGCFLVSRHLLSRPVRRLIARRPLLVALDRTVAEEGWRVVLLIRLNPLVPFNVQNYTFGVTQLGFVPYAAATAVGIVPSTVLHVYLGILGRGAGGGPWTWAIAGLGLVATVTLTLLMARKARAVLAQKGVA